MREGSSAVLEAEYRAGIGAGPARVHRHGAMIWVSDASGTLAGTLSLELP